MRLITILGSLIALAAPARGGSRDAGDAGGPPGRSVTTVVKALSARDDTPCALTGRIVRREAGDRERYLFRDATGDIIVEIGDELFLGRTVTPQAPVRIWGEVEKEAFKRTKIAVERIEIR